MPWSQLVVHLLTSGLRRISRKILASDAGRCTFFQARRRMQDVICLQGGRTLATAMTTMSKLKESQDLARSPTQAANTHVQKHTRPVVAIGPVPLWRSLRRQLANNMGDQIKRRHIDFMVDSISVVIYIILVV